MKFLLDYIGKQIYSGLHIIYPYGYNTLFPGLSHLFCLSFCSNTPCSHSLSVVVYMAVMNICTCRKTRANLSHLTSSWPSDFGEGTQYRWFVKLLAHFARSSQSFSLLKAISFFFRPNNTKSK